MNTNKTQSMCLTHEKPIFTLSAKPQNILVVISYIYILYIYIKQAYDAGYFIEKLRGM